ncbi:MAG: hypothetical protein ACI95C_001942 [Pseudohongiellaceae bacterium]
MNETWAKRSLMTMMFLCVILGLIDTFVDQDMITALVFISSFFVFKFAWKTPKLLMATSYKEFGEVVDTVEGISEITGSPAYFISVIICVLYILLF